MLRAIAFRKMERSSAKEWDSHLMQCSPCFVEYVAFRDQAQPIQSIRRLATAAAIVIVCVGLRFAFKSKILRTPSNGQIADHGAVETCQPELADLRDLAPLRGVDGKTPAPAELTRGHLALTLYLPTGSEPGRYEVGMAEQLDQPLATAAGSATLRNGIAVLEVRIDLTSLHPGLYLLAIRQAGRTSAPFTLLLK
ncbi:MAG: hypothetical protein ACLQVL_20740 [Terriglobia bacterium]